MSQPTTADELSLEPIDAHRLPAQVSPPLDAAGLEELAQLGEERAVDVGDVLISAGDDASLTDRSLPSTATSRPTFSARAPLPYAGGDVRSGSSKRVVTAVGEGSAAVRSVHEYLATI